MNQTLSINYLTAFYIVEEGLQRFKSELKQGHTAVIYIIIAIQQVSFYFYKVSAQGQGQTPGAIINQINVKA